MNRTTLCCGTKKLRANWPCLNMKMPPAMMVTDTALFRYPDYHTGEDTPDKVDYERLARVDVPRVAVRPQQHGGAVARRGVPGVQTPAVLGDEPALLDAGGRSADTPVGEEDELVDPHRATRQEEAR